MTPLDYSDYKTHYRIDGEIAVDRYHEFSPAQRASEQRRMEAIVHLGRFHRGDRVADIGCGSGFLAAKLRASGCKVFALDLSKIGLQNARKESNTSVFVLADVYDLPFKTGTLDGVVLSEVLEHLSNLPASLLEVKRSLKIDGKVAISVPFKEKIRFYLCIHCNRLTPAYAHLHSFDDECLIGLLESCGFQIERTRRFSNKILEMVNFPLWSKFLPYSFWSSIDRLFNRILGKAAFLCVIVKKGRDAKGELNCQSRSGWIRQASCGSGSTGS